MLSGHQPEQALVPLYTEANFFRLTRIFFRSMFTVQMDTPQKNIVFTQYAAAAYLKQAKQSHTVRVCDTAIH